MDSNEKLGLIERVGHASEDQAKRTLKYMILKCNVKQDTIARAIKDAIEKHTPTPMILYQQPESEDDDEAAINSTLKKSDKRQKDQDGSSDEEDDARSAPAKRRHRTLRGDINPDPNVGNLILENTKTKLKKDKRSSRDHDEEQKRPNASKKNKSKHASEPRAETKQRIFVDLKGTASKQKSPPVIDLVTSSDDESSATEQSRNDILSGKSSGDDDSDNDSTDDSSSDSDSSDDGSSEDEPQGGALADGLSHDGSNKKAIQGNARSGDGRRTVARPVTFSMAKASKQNDSNKIGPSFSSKKRKVPEPTVGEVSGERPAKPASDAHVDKRSKPNHPQEPPRSPDLPKCRKCGILFPSVAQLLKHQVYFKGLAATMGSRSRSESPSGDHTPLLQQVKKASHPTGGSSPEEPHRNLRLPSRPRQRSPAGRVLLVPSQSSVRVSNILPRGPKATNVAVARSLSSTQSLQSDLAHRPVPKPSADSSLGQQSQPPRPESGREHLIQEH